MSKKQKVAKGPQQPAPVSAAWRLDVLVCLALIALCLLLRCWRLSQPNELYFDERFYVRSAVQVLTNKRDTNPLPPMGKLMIAAFIRTWYAIEMNLLGGHDNSVPCLAWRWGSLSIGTLTVVLLYFLGKSMFGRKVGALAAFLLAVDFLHIVQSRIATLDIYQGLFVLLYLWCVWEYVKASGSDVRWPLLGGVALGLGTATKWSTLFTAVGALPAVLCLQEVEDAAPWYRQKQRWMKLGKAVGIVLPLLVLTYALCYIPQLRINNYSISATFHRFQVHGKLMVRYRYSKKFRHRYMSRWYSWPTVMRPVWYRFDRKLRVNDSIFQAWVTNGGNDVHNNVILPRGDGKNRPSDMAIAADQGWIYGVVAMGSPLVWWSFLALLLVLLAYPVKMLCARLLARGPPLQEGSGVPPMTPVQKAVTLCVLTYLSQLLLWWVNRGFLYYMLPCTIQMSLLLAWAAVWLWRNWRFGKTVVILFMTGTVASLALYWPLLVGYPIPASLFWHLMLFKNWV